MALIVNGQPAERARATMPRQGAWVIDVVVPDPAAIADPVTLAMDGELTFGRHARAGRPLARRQLPPHRPGRQRAEAPGQAEGVPERHAAVGSARPPADGGRDSGAELGRQAAGDAISVVDAGRDAIGRCLSALIMDRRLTAPVWRSLPRWDGVGSGETWPDSGLTEPGDYQDMAELPQEGRAELGVEAWTLTPGDVAGRRRHISDVEHNLDGRPARSTVWFE